MTSIYKPNDYTPVFASPEFKINVESTEFFDCTIKSGSDEVLGAKRLGGALSYNVNVANYAKRGLGLRPLVAQEMGFVEPEGRVGGIYIEAGDLCSSEAKISAARIELSYDQFLSELSTKRDIAYGESDELCFFTMGGDISASILVKSANGICSVLEDICYESANEGYIVFVVRPDDLGVMLEDQLGCRLEDYEGFEIVIKQDAQTLASVDYSIVEADGRRVRLCWWNDYGAVDYYSFYCGDGAKISTQKQLVRLDGGYRAECSQIEYSRQLYSRNLTSGDARGLAKIIYAPMVWVCRGEQVCQVAVSTNSIAQSEGQMPIVGFEILEIGTQQD